MWAVPILSCMYMCSHNCKPRFIILLYIPIQDLAYSLFISFSLSVLIDRVEEIGQAICDKYDLNDRLELGSLSEPNVVSIYSIICSIYMYSI